jgi:predicted RNA binding protein YcfA (HicA-like mRNA interferase family)
MLILMKARDVRRALRGCGWYLDRQKGSHEQYKNPDRDGLVTLADHGGDIPRGTLKSIGKQAGIKFDKMDKKQIKRVRKKGYAGVPPKLQC